MANKRIPRKKGQKRNSKKHSDLYTDENPKGTIKGLKFATVKDAKASVSKIKKSSRSHNHKTQAAIAMEQRAKAAGKKSAAAVYRKFIDQQKKKTKAKNETTRADLFLDRPTMHVDYDEPVNDQIADYMVDMMLIREYVHGIIVENMASVAGDTMITKFKKLIDKYVAPPGWQVEDPHFFESGGGNSLIGQIRLQGTREALPNLDSAVEKQKLSAIYAPFAQRRGWNLLQVREEPLPSRNPVIMYELKFDKQPNTKNTNYFMSTQELQIKEHVLLHLTKESYLKSIQAGGFKPARSSSDGINFGNGRAYFVACSRMDWEDSRDSAIGWFARATETEGFAGISTAEKQVLLVIDPEKMRNNIQFYVDTEFGYGTGTVGYSGVWGGKAIYTPGHIRATTIEEVIDL